MVKSKAEVTAIALDKLAAFERYFVFPENGRRIFSDCDRQLFVAHLCEMYAVGVEDAALAAAREALTVSRVLTGKSE